jgi:integrase
MIFILASYFHTAMASVNLQTVDARNKLKPRRDPYFATIRKGCALGFRKMTTSTTGTWVARCLSETTGKQQHAPLGDFEGLPASQRYGAALEAAEAFFKQVGMGATLEVKTVKDACEAYASHLRSSEGGRDKSEAKADEAHSRFARVVYPHPLAKLALSKLNMGHLEKWRTELAAKPVVINPHAPASKQRTRDRSASSVNREVTALRAALNHAHDRGHVASDVAWLSALKPTKGADKARDVYLTKEQRRALLDASPDDLRNFIHGMCALPLRPGALAQLTAGDFNKRLCVLTIDHDKAGEGRKVTLQGAAAELLKRMCKDKLPSAPIFSRANGKAWDRDSWKKPFKTAAQAAKLPEKATAYSLRHSTITDLCTSGLDLLTVARLSGTSAEMIDRHYGHHRQEHASKALEVLAL